METENKVTFIEATAGLSIPVFKCGNALGFQVFVPMSVKPYKLLFARGTREQLANSRNVHVIDSAVVALPDEMKLGFCEGNTVTLVNCHVVVEENNEKTTKKT